MKSNLCELNKDPSCIANVLCEVEKVTNYNNLEPKKALKIRLLAEELCGMLPSLVEKFNGVFWAQNNEEEYELHVELRADKMDIAIRDELIAVSKSGKNSAAKGVMGKIRAVAETMMLSVLEIGMVTPTGDFYDDNGYNMGYGFLENTVAMERGYTYSWSLASYITNVEEKKEDDAQGELERSIVAKLADDITVGVKGKNVEIVVIKKGF